MCLEPGSRFASIEDSVNAPTTTRVQHKKEQRDTSDQKHEKQHYGYFKGQTRDISKVKIWSWLRKGNLKRERDSPLISAQNKIIRTKYVKAKIQTMQQNSQNWLCGDRDETINDIISECSKLVQKYKFRHASVVKGIYGVFCKKFRFGRALYMHKPESLLENEMHKLP